MLSYNSNRKVTKTSTLSLAWEENLIVRIFQTLAGARSITDYRISFQQWPIYPLVLQLDDFHVLALLSDMIKSDVFLISGAIYQISSHLWSHDFCPCFILSPLRKSMDFPISFKVINSPKPLFFKKKKVKLLEFAKSYNKINQIRSLYISINF